MSEPQDASTPRPAATPVRGRLSDLVTRFGRAALELDCILGTTQLKLREILSLKTGSVVSLTRPAGEDVDVRLNGTPLGQAEVMIVETRVLLRVTELDHG